MSEGRATGLTVGEPVLRSSRRHRNIEQARQQTDRKVVDIEEESIARAQANDARQASVAVSGYMSDQNEGPKPWETLVIGASLGNSLSRIEYKNREILQQKFIIEWSKRNEPQCVEARQELLNEMLLEREQMEDTEENNMPADQLHAKTAVAKRLKALRTAVEYTDFNTQRINIEAAITGYETGVIKCSGDYTLLYAGAIVDTCPSYHSFATDRNERLDRYAEEFGPGWLWYEPPLAGSDSGSYAKKGFSIDQYPWHLPPNHKVHGEDFGMWSIKMRFVVDENKVRRSAKAPPPSSKRRRAVQDSEAQDFPRGSATFAVMLDSGSTFPMLTENDLSKFGITNMQKNYTAQTVWSIQTAQGLVENCPLFDLDVGVGAALNENNSSPLNKPPGWPREQGILGGLCPVGILPMISEPVKWTDRLSGIFPFKVCYMSSVPTTGRIWLGENRRDVLGAQRFPPYRRHITDGKWAITNSQGVADYDEAISSLGTPDEVIFAHEIDDFEKPGSYREFLDIDSRARNKTTYGMADIKDRKNWIDDSVEFSPV
ncbi:putative Peptidase A2 domain-containing protein [Seiridium cardinale]